MASVNKQYGAICAGKALVDGGRGVRFIVKQAGLSYPAFVVRYGGKVYGYVNQCAHKLVELDWEEGLFFDAEKRYLICATHGARYEPDTGACIGGPCNGAGLTKLDVEERDGWVYLGRHNDIHLIKRDPDKIGPPRVSTIQ